MNIDEYGQYWEYMTPETAIWYRDYSETFLRWLLWPIRNNSNHANHITLSMIFYEMRKPMTRKKVGSNVSSKSDTSRNSSGTRSGTFNWVNVKLSSEDAIVLDESDATLQELSARFCSLGDDGYGGGIRNLDSGDTICITITHPSIANPGSTVAISGFGSNVRDALLVLLYKFDVKLGGELPDDGEQVTPQKPRFR